jgi:AcrR family transcriptional regulator
MCLLAYDATMNPQSDARRRPGPKPSLSHELILSEARNSPAGDVNLRELAERLGVSTAALYRYFADRDALIEALVHACVRDLEPPPSGLRWRETLEAAGVRLYELIQQNTYLSGAEVWVAVRAVESRFQQAVVSTLMGVGFTKRDAVDAFTVVCVHSVSLGQGHRGAPSSRNELDRFFHRSMGWVISGIPEPISQPARPASASRRSADPRDVPHSARQH